MPVRPTREEQLAARGRSLRPVIAPGLGVLLCGINPSLYSAAVGHHFAGPSNRFWKVLHLAGFTPRLLRHDEDRTLPTFGCGVTNLVNFATARADELTPDQLVAGGRRITRQVRRYAPRALAVVGVGAYRVAFAQPRAVVGEQPQRIGDTRVWVLPNPSGLNANYQLPELVRLYRQAREAVNASLTPPRPRRGTTSASRPRSPAPRGRRP